MEIGKQFPWYQTQYGSGFRCLPCFADATVINYSLGAFQDKQSWLTKSPCCWTISGYGSSTDYHVHVCMITSCFKQHCFQLCHVTVHEYTCSTTWIYAHAGIYLLCVYVSGDLSSDSLSVFDLLVFTSATSSLTDSGSLFWSVMCLVDLLEC